MKQRFIIQEINQPRTPKRDDSLLWFCASLGISKPGNPKDIPFRIVKEILKMSKERILIPTELLSKILKLEPPRVNYHLRNLAESGVFEREKRMITIRGGSLESAIERIRSDANHVLDEIGKVSREIDKQFRLS